MQGSDGRRCWFLYLLKSQLGILPQRLEFKIVQKRLTLEGNRDERQSISSKTLQVVRGQPELGIGATRRIYR